MRQSRKKMINVTCSQSIKKQVDSFLATEYKAWKTLLSKDSSAANKEQNGLKGYFACTDDNSNTLLMEYVRYIYKEYGIPDPLAMQGEGQAGQRERLSDLIKNQRQSTYIQKSEEEIKRISMSPKIKQKNQREDEQSPIKLIESKYSPERRDSQYSSKLQGKIQFNHSVDYTPVKKPNYSEELERTQYIQRSIVRQSNGHRRQSSELMKVNMTTGRTDSKLHTEKSQEFLKNSGAATERKNVRFLFGSNMKSEEISNNLERSLSRNQQLKHQLDYQKKSVPNIMLGAGPGRNTLIKIQDINENNGSNQSSHIKSTLRGDESPIKQEFYSQETKHTDNAKQHMKFSRKINSLTLRSDQPVPEIYRYCLACENAVLEENIERHQVICPNFKEMYHLDLEGLLSHLQNKIENIRGKLEGQAEHLEEKDATTMKNLSRQLSRQSLSIFKSGSISERFVKDYNSAISIGKKWGETSENVNKLRWFIKVREQLKEHFNV